MKKLMNLVEDSGVSPFLVQSVVATCFLVAFLIVRYGLGLSLKDSIIFIICSFIIATIIYYLIYIIINNFKKIIFPLITLIICLSLIAYYCPSSISSILNKPIKLIFTVQKTNYKLLDVVEPKVTIYQYNYFKIVIPTDLDTSKQKISKEQIIRDLNTIDKKLVSMINEIRILDYINKCEENDGALTLASHYTINDYSIIELYASDRDNSSDCKYILCHELGHMLNGNTKLISATASYIDTVKKDDIAYINTISEYIKDAKKDNNTYAHFPSTYANNYFIKSGTYLEDFAESFAIYMTEPKTLKNLFPNRYSFFKNLSKETEA